MDVSGHLGMGLLWAAPAWLAWDGRTAVRFTAVALVGALLPDIDLYLSQLLATVVHHGVTHTLVFVAIGAIAAGALTLVVLSVTRWDERRGRRASWVALLVAVALFVGGASHLFADMLSAPDIAQPVEPFWPFFNKPVSLDVLYYSAPLWNYGLLLVALVVHAGLSQVDSLPLGGRDVGASGRES